MDESVLASFSEVNFIEGSTYLTQQNWQEYFSPVIKNGIYEGLEPRNYITSTAFTNGRRIITDGTVFANGICAKISTSNGYTDIGTLPSGARDRFICVRVYFDSQTAELIQKTNIIPELTPTETQWGSVTASYLHHYYALNRFERYEDYCCDRNDLYWDIPILYQTPINTAYSEGVDLRRLIKHNSTEIMNPSYTGLQRIPDNSYIISGSNHYRIQMTSNPDTSQYPYLETLHDVYLYFDPINKPNKAKVYIHGANARSSQDPSVTEKVRVYIPNHTYVRNNLLVPYSVKQTAATDYDLYWYDNSNPWSFTSVSLSNPLVTYEDTMYYRYMEFSMVNSTSFDIIYEFQYIESEGCWNVPFSQTYPYSEKQVKTLDIFAINRFYLTL